MSGPAGSRSAPPAALGKYAVRGKLGEGAMGTVYDGWDPVIDRRVAIKTVGLPATHDEEAQEGLARFKREAQAAGRLHHPNIVGVYDYGETDEVAFIVMEFVDGQTLKEALHGDQRLPLPEITRVMHDILAGLAYSHGRGVVHRDIKPANIMLTADQRAKIADFGIARIESSSMTQAGTVLGTPAYMSPEQFMGQTVDRRTDIYSLGVLLYQLLTGERPFDGSLTAIMHKALNTMPPRPSELSVTAPTALDPVVARAMARRPEDRFDSAEAFAKALDDALQPAMHDPDATMVAGPSAPIPALRTPAITAPAPAVVAGRSKAPLVVAGLVGLLIAGGGAAWFALSGQPAAVVASIPPVSSPKPPIEKPPAPDVASPPLRTPDPGATTQQASTSDPAPPVQPPTPRIEPPTPMPTVPQEKFASTPPKPEPPPPPIRSVAAVSSALATGLPAIGCTLAHASVSPDIRATVTGVAGRGTPDAALRTAVASADPASADWQVAEFDGPYCPALDLLRPVADAASRAGNTLAMTEADGRATLADNEIIAMNLAMPGFGGYVYVAYLQHDGTMSPLVPGAGYPARSYAAGAKVEFGRPHDKFDGWRVGPPFGTDMIVAVASSAQLFSAALPDQQPTASYLRDLQAAMDGVRRRGGSLAANVMLLDTRPGP